MECNTNYVGNVSVLREQGLVLEQKSQRFHINRSVF